LDLPVRVGARADMDIVEKVPAVYDPDGTFNRWDFILYEAVQHFNVHSSVPRLLAEIDGALSNTSFGHWKTRMGFRESAIEKCSKENAHDIEKAKTEEKQRFSKEFMSKLSVVLDGIERGPRGIRLAQKLMRARGRSSPDEIRGNVQKFIEREFQRVAGNILPKVLEVCFESDHPGLLRIFFSVHDPSHAHNLCYVWAGIPTRGIAL
jgi:hypothetical protein